MRYRCAEPYTCDDFYQHQGAKVRYICEHDEDIKASMIYPFCKIAQKVVIFTLIKNPFKEEIDKILEI